MEARLNFIIRKICYSTPLLYVICQNTLPDSAFAGTHRIAKTGKFGTFSSNQSSQIKVLNFLFWHCGVLWQMCHKIIMMPSKDTIEQCVSANTKK
jgi:hypothetical protein